MAITDGELTEPEVEAGVSPERSSGSSGHRHLAGARASGRSGRSGGTLSPSGESPWRGDIQGLRGVAILAVVLFHADSALLPGGFIGVDVFYVISGFLITGLLVRELERDGRISFRDFYARRIRRLLPMALVVLVATVAVADLLQSPLDAARTAKDALASALYVANYRFALQQTNYLDAGIAPSPFQHYWSLGVEEQMYVVWPLLLFAASGVWRRGRVSARWAVGVLFAGSVCSFLFCLRLTHTNEPWAFFSFPTRAWELGVGGLIAFAAPSLRTLPRGVAPFLGLTGLGAVLWSAFHFGNATPWPGDSAALPVLGASAIIAAGCARRGQISAHLLAFPPLQFAGRISYSWYLWHWPVLVLSPLVLNHALDAAQALSLAAGSGLLATASYYLVERPIHLSRWLVQRARRGLFFGVGLTASGVAVCVGSVVALALPTASANAVRPVLVPTAVSRVAHGDPDAALLATSTAEIQSALIFSEDTDDVPTDLTPSLGGAFANEPTLYQDGCVDSFTSIAVGPCEYGDTTSSTKVILFGDSHAAMWFPTVEQAADRYRWNLYAWTKDTCPPVELPIISPDLGRSYDECTTWRDAVLEEIAEIRPALVVLGVARHYSPIYGFTTYSPVWLNALAQMVTLIRQMGSEVLVLGPVPKPTFSVPSCLSENLESATLCSTDRGSGVDLPGMREEESVVRNAGGSYLNTLFWFCTPSGICPPTVDDVLVYRDDNHITVSYANLLDAPVEAALDLAVRGAPAPGSAVFLAPDRS